MAIWQREILTFTLLFFAVCIIGLFTKLFLPLLFGLLVFTLYRHLYEINRLEKWLRTGAQGNYPKSSGVWEEVYYHVYRIKKK